MAKYFDGGKKILTDSEGQDYYAEYYPENSQDQNYSKDEGQKGKLTGEDFLSEMKAVSDKDRNQSAEMQKEDKDGLSSEGFLSEMKNVAEPKKEQEQTSEPSAEQSESSEQKQSFIRRLLNSIPIFGKAIANTLLGDENEGKTLVSVEVSHPGFEKDSVQKNVIESASGLNERLADSVSSQIFGKKSQVNEEKTATEPSVSSDIPGIDSKKSDIDSNKEDKKDQSLEDVLNKCIEDAKDDPEKMKQMEKIIEKYQNWNEQGDSIKDPELKKLTDHCKGQIDQINKEREKGGQDKDNQTEATQSQTQSQQQESQNSNEGQNGLITSIADSKTANQMNEASKGIGLSQYLEKGGNSDLDAIVKALNKHDAERESNKDDVTVDLESIPTVNSGRGK